MNSNVDYLATEYGYGKYVTLYVLCIELMSLKSSPKQFISLKASPDQFISLKSSLNQSTFLKTSPKHLRYFKQLGKWIQSTHL